MYRNHRSEPWNSVILKQLLKELGESVYQLIITIPRKPLLGGSIVNSSKGSFGLGQRSVKSWTPEQFSVPKYEFAVGTAIRNVVQDLMTPEDASRMAQALYDAADPVSR